MGQAWMACPPGATANSCHPHSKSGPVQVLGEAPPTVLAAGRWAVTPAGQPETEVALPSWCLREKEQKHKAPRIGCDARWHWTSLITTCPLGSLGLCFCVTSHWWKSCGPCIRACVCVLCLCVLCVFVFCVCICVCVHVGWGGNHVCDAAKGTPVLSPPRLHELLAALGVHCQKAELMS